MFQGMLEVDSVAEFAQLHQNTRRVDAQVNILQRQFAAYRRLQAQRFRYIMTKIDNSVGVINNWIRVQAVSINRAIW